MHVEHIKNTNMLNNNEDVLTTFKIKGNKYFSYYDNINKKMQYKEIKNGSVKDCDLKLEDTNKNLIKQNKQIDTSTLPVLIIIAKILIEKDIE